MGFFIDQNIIGVARALAEVRPDTLHPGHVELPEVPLGTLDPDWIPVVAARGLVVITRDKKLRFKAAEKSLLQEHGLRVMALTGENDMTSWEMLVRLMQRWTKIEREIARHGPGYWWCSVTAGGVKRRHQASAYLALPSNGTNVRVEGTV